MGQPLTIVTQQQKGGTGATTITTVTKNSYDALGRVVKTTKQIKKDAGALSAEKAIAMNRYDALGQLVQKTLGPTDANGTAGAEKQIYEYNIRGWLLGMNRGYANNANTAHKFGFELTYDKAPHFTGSNFEPQYSGNISGMSWRGKDPGDNIRRYEYKYDAANRIMKGDFWRIHGSGFIAGTTGTAGSIMYDMQMGNGADPNSAYDLNGNIKKMIHYGYVPSANHSILIDNLSYAYRNNGLSNKLARVTDAVTTNTGLGDFTNGTNSGDDYDYDPNGNLTKDLNKNISAISYNVLNLPEQITVANKGTISYQYDAAGVKLSKTVNETGVGQRVTQYLNGLIFDNNVLQHVATEEGRARLESSAWKYDYFVTDHLGNVRSVLAENGAVLEENHYYPFGLVQKGISARASGSLRNKEKTFQNQQIDEELDLNWVQFKWRNHNPQIGRFNSVDPKADEYRHNGRHI